MKTDGKGTDKLKKQQDKHGEELLEARDTAGIETRQDMAPEEPEAAAEAQPQAEEPAPKSEQELLQEKYDELNDRYLRLLAEYDNFRKRTTREKDEIYQHATSTVVSKFLPVLDNFERAREFDKSGEDFAKGFDMIYTGMLEVFASLGVESFGEVGEPFDAEKHNAVMHIEDDALGENVVAQVLQKGYKLGDRIIRHAMVQTAN